MKALLPGDLRAVAQLALRLGDVQGKRHADQAQHLARIDGPYAAMLARVQRLVDMGRFRGPADEAARTVWAASNGALSLLLRGASRKQVESVSRTLFDAVVRALSSPAT